MAPPTQTCDITSTMTPYTFSHRSSNKVSKCTKKYEHIQNCGGVSRNAARERYRVKSLRDAFHSLQKCLPSVPPNTKLSKLDVLILATTYISHLSRILSEDEAAQESTGIPNIDFDLSDDSVSPLIENETRNQSWEKSYLHPVRKWPMRSRLYAGVEEDNSSSEQTTLTMYQKPAWI